MLPVTNVNESEKILFNTYDYIKDENPERFIRQRITGSVSSNRASFRVQPNVPNLLLSARAWIKWTWNIEKIKTSDPVTDENFTETTTTPTLGDFILLKPFMAMANATTSIRLAINGKGITYNEPRYWQKYMGSLFCPEKYINGYFSTAGGRYPIGKGAYNLTGQPDAALGATTDINFDISADLAFENYLTEVGNDSLAQIVLYEPLYVGCFNWAFDFKDELASGYWGKYMSNLIPYVRDIQYDISFNNFPANALYYFYGQTSGAGFESLKLRDEGLIEAEMIIEWVKPKNMTIEYQKTYPNNVMGLAATHLIPRGLNLPESVKLQSWYYDHRQFSINNGDLIANSEQASIDIPEIHIYSVPTYILMFATNDKDHPNYQAVSVLSSDNTGSNLNQSLNVNSLESNMEFEELNIQIGSDRDIISERYTSQELYNITLKNSKKDFPWSYSKYLGGKGRQATYVGNYCVLFKSDDLNITRTTGQLTVDFLIKIKANLGARTGFHVKGLSGSYAYKFHIVFLYSQYYMAINSKGDVEWSYESQF